jgi:hypothetical protein
MTNGLLYDYYSNGIIQNDGRIRFIYDGFYIGYKDTDLTDVIAIDIRTSCLDCKNDPNYIDIYIDGLNGTLIGIFEAVKTNGYNYNNGATNRAKIVETFGKHDLYFLFRDGEPKSGKYLFDILGWELVFKEPMILIKENSKNKDINTIDCQGDNPYFFFNKGNGYIYIEEVDFTYAIGIKIKLSALKSGSSLDIYIDGSNDSTGTLIGILNVNATTNKNNIKWEIQYTEIEQTFGIHDLYLVFRCNEEANAYSLNIYSWKLEYHKNCMVSALSFSQSSNDEITKNIDSEVIHVENVKNEDCLVFKNIILSEATSIVIRTSSPAGSNYIDILINNDNGDHWNI